MFWRNGTQRDSTDLISGSTESSKIDEQTPNSEVAPKAPVNKILIYGRASSIDGRRATIAPDRRQAYNSSANKLREAAARAL